MKISSRVDYALSCLIRIAERYRTAVLVSVASIAVREELDVDYVEQLLIIMKRAGLLRSIRGLKGGYVLAKSPAHISACEVLQAFEGNILELVCFRKKGRRSRCIHLGRCNVRTFWTGMRATMERYLKRTTLAQLVALRKSGEPS